MGMSAGGKSGAIKSEINVTPLVDVVLVLLIIFLVTMPVMMRQLTLEIPRKVMDNESTISASKQLRVLVKGDGKVVIDNGSTQDSVNRVDLAKTLKPKVQALVGEKVVFVDFDDDVMYVDAVSVMDTVAGVGASKVALKTRDEGQ